MVAHLPSKQMVAGSSPVSRSTLAVSRDGGHMVAVLHGFFPHQAAVLSVSCSPSRDSKMLSI